MNLSKSPTQTPAPDQTGTGNPPCCPSRPAVLGDGRFGIQQVLDPVPLVDHGLLHEDVIREPDARDTRTSTYSPVSSITACHKPNTKSVPIDAIYVVMDKTNRTLILS